MRKNLKVAVLAHVFYLDQLEFICERLKRINYKFVLYISCSSIEDREFIEKFLGDKKFEVKIFVIENIGMDVIPFLECSTYALEDGVDVVCKIHTKNTKSQIRTIQRQLSFDSVLYSSSSIDLIINSFEKNSHLGLIGSGLMYRSVQSLMYGNREKYRDLCNELGVDGDIDTGFVAGTMFWVRLEVIEPLLARVSHFKKKMLSEVYVTGGDGTYAHALERLVTSFVALSNYSTQLFDPLISQNLYERELLGDVFYRSGPTEVIGRLRNYDNIRFSIKSAGNFDPEYYQNKYMLCESVELLNHYILIGEFNGYNANPDFDSGAYSVHSPDIRANGLSPLYHYSTSGLREGRPTNFSKENICKYLIKKNYIDIQRLRAVYRRQDFPTDSCALDAYSKTGHLISEVPSKILGFKLDCFDDVSTYFSERAYSDEMSIELMQRAFDHKDYVTSSYIADQLIEHSIPTQQIYCCSAISKMRMHKWNEAKVIWQEYFNISRQVLLTNRFKWPENMITQGKDKEVNIKGGNDHSKRICVYTALFGDFDELLPPLVSPPDIDFICFTDTDTNVNGWKSVKIQPGFDSDNLNAKIFKILPHKYLENYDYSLFVDANTLFTGNVSKLIEQYLSDEDFVMWRHPERNDVYTEAELILQILRHEPDSIMEQIKNYHADGLESFTGLYEASFIWRNHKSPEIISFMECWWDEITKYSKRDQLSLGYLTWKKDLKPKLLPQYLGTSRKNYCFEKLPHLKNHFNSNSQASSSLVMPASCLQVKNFSLYFIFADKFRYTGSTVMRGQQLSELSKKHLPTNYTVNYTNRTFQKNAILFLTKGYLKTVESSELSALRKQGNILLFDFVDDKPRAEIIEYADALIASSISAFIEYKKRFKKTAVYLVTHHVDPRIRQLSVPTRDTPSCCYAGEIVNTLKGQRTSNLVDFIGVDTSKQTSDWIDMLPKYNIHYAIRLTRGIDGNKPFLKGFTAAALESNLIIQRSQQEALYYLTEDYPYIYDGALTDLEISDFTKSVYDSYGSTKWKYGLEIMQDVNNRCSDVTVVRELQTAIESILN